MKSTETVRNRKDNRIDEALCDPKNVSKFFSEYPSLLVAIQSKDDEKFHDTMIDFMDIYEETMESASPKQVEVVELLQGGYNHREIGEMIGVTKQAVQRRVMSVCERIAQQYRYKYKQ